MSFTNDRENKKEITNERIEKYFIRKETGVRASERTNEYKPCLQFVHCWQLKIEIGNV